MYKLKKIVGSNIFSAQFIKIISHYKKIGHTINVLQQTACLVVRPNGVYLLDFFCSGIQFYLLLSPYVCFISLLYLDLYVVGDDGLIS